MENKERLINWLKEHENKPVEISIINYELGDYREFIKGFTIKEHSIQDGVDIVNNIGKHDYICLLCNDYDNIEFITNKNLTEMNANVQLSINDHFTILFYFL